MTDLPNGWAIARFEQLIASISNGMPGNQNKDGIGVPVSRIETISRQTIDFSRIGYVGTFNCNDLNQYKLEFGDILFSHINSPAHLGKTAIFQDTRDLYHGINLLRIKIEAGVCTPIFFDYACKFLRFRGEFILHAQHAVNQASLNQRKIKDFRIAIPPLIEQSRITNKINTVLTRVDACRDRLARVAPLLKRFRQSVLAAATSGRLTADWRDDQKVISALDWIETINESRIHLRRSAIKPRREDIILSDGIPDSWCVTGLDEIAADKPNALKAGPFGSALKKSMYVNDGYKVSGQEQVIAGDENTGDYYISEEKFRELDSCKVIPGDILVSLVGTIGRVLILSATARVGIINPRLVKFSLHPGVHRAFFALYLQSPLATAFFQGKSHGGTMDVLNLGILRSLPILLPSPAEQVEIVRRVETLFAFADRLEARLKTAQTAADRLTPALLAKAFRGELVPQDPNDEPAAELLKRLATSRDAAPKAKRGRRSATADTTP